jgi:hypothetical protein
MAGWASACQKSEMAEIHTVGKIPASLIDSRPLGSLKMMRDRAMGF